MEQVRSTGSHGLALILLVLVMLAGLPVAVWLDLRNLSESSLLRQAKDLNSVVSSVRSYYASNVVGRVLASPARRRSRTTMRASRAPYRSPRHFRSNLAA